jgi:hypothetical protein
MVMMHHRFKKPVALLVLAALLLNIGGELALHQYLVHQSDKFFNKQTSRGLYNVNDLTEVKIPVDMPGISDWQGYENMFGQVKFADDAYNFVKIKMTHNAIYLLCVPNYETTHLATQNIIHAENIKDIPIPKKQHVPFGKVIFVSNCYFAFARLEISAPFCKAPVVHQLSVSRQLSRNPDIPEQPPRFAC